MRIAMIYLALVSFGFSQPLFNIVVLFRREFHISFLDAVLVVAVFQYGVVLFLLGLRVLVRGLREYMDYLVYFFAVIGVIREVQQTYIETEGLDLLTKAGLLIGMLAGASIVIFILRRQADSALHLAGFLCPIFGGVFLYQLATHAIPLQRAADETPAEISAPPVMLVLLDELSLEMLLSGDGEIDAAVFPNFHRLSRKGVWYRRAIANYLHTTYSVPSLLTGSFKIGDRMTGGSMLDDLERLPPQSLLRRLSSEGYRVVVYSNHMACGGQKFSCHGYLSGGSAWFLARVLGKFIEEFGPDFLVNSYLPQLTGMRLLSEHDFLKNIASDLRNGTFYFIHLMTSHEPYVFDRTGRFHYSRHNRMAMGSDFPATLANYREQLRYLDTVMGEFLEKLKRYPHGRQPVVAVISDHGNCWTADCPGRINPRLIRTIEPSLVRIPVMLFGSGIAPRIDDDDFQLVDLLPTLLEAIGLPIPNELTVDGAPRLNSPPPPRRRHYYLMPGNAPVSLKLPAVSEPVGRVVEPTNKH